MDTITAISTPIGVGGISIIRMSGKEALDILARVFECKTNPRDFEPRKLYLGRINGEGFSEQCLAVYFRAPFSYTGEDVVEFQCHGGALITRRMLELLVKCGARPADRGEFTRRAFLNGKMNLSECEGVIDMLNADSDSALKAGYRLLKGELSNTVVDIQDQLTGILSGINGALDYPEELYDEVYEGTKPKLEEIANRLKSLIDSANKGKMIRDGVNVAIVGAPNSGKSSLLNKILHYDRAIVTDIAGTTRDTLTESIIYDDVKINITDTAGIREGRDEVERIGILRSREAIEGADVTLMLIDGSRQLDDDERDLLHDIEKIPHIICINKSDKPKVVDIEGMSICALSGEGVDDLMHEVVSRTVGKTDGEVITHVRHLDAITRAYDYLLNAMSTYDEQPIDIVAIDLTGAWTALGEITGTTCSEDIVDRIFRDFCVGK